MVEFAFGADGAAVGEHDVLGDGEAEAGAAGFAGTRFVDAIEAFEKARQMFGGDAGAEILHIEFDADVVRVARAPSTMRPPERPYFMALSIRFENTWWMASRSARTGGSDSTEPIRIRVASTIFNSTPWLRAISRKLSSASCRSSTGGTGSVSKRVSPDSTRASVSRSSVRRDMRAAFLRMISRNSRLWSGIVGAEVEESFGVSLNRGQRGAELVGDVGNEIAAGFFDALGLGQIAQHSDGAAIGQRGGGDIEGAAGDDGSGAGGLDLFRGGGGFHGGEEIGIANGFDNRRVEARVLGNKAIHGLVGPLHEAVGADGDDGVLHAVEQGFELALAGLHGGKTALDLAGGFVDGGGDAANFVERTCLRRGPEDRPARCGRRHRRCVRGGGKSRRTPTAAISKRDEEGDGRTPNQAAMHLRLHGFDIGKRIGEAHCASGNWRGDIEKRNAESGAAALVLAGLAGESGGEFLAGGVVLHVGRIGFGVGENFSGSVDDGGAGAGGQALPARRFRRASGRGRFRRGARREASSASGCARSRCAARLPMRRRS